MTKLVWSEDEILEQIEAFNKPDRPGRDKISARLETHSGGDFTIWIDREDSDGNVVIISAIYDDLDALVKMDYLLDQWEIYGYVETYLAWLGREYARAVVAGDGDWHKGKTAIERKRSEKRSQA